MTITVEMFEYEFMRNALCAVILVTPLFGILSTMVVSNRMAFFSDSLGHGAFTGIALGAILGVGSEIFGLIIFSIIFALLITYIKNKAHSGADTVIGVFSSTAIALGLMLMSAGGQFNKFSKFLIGDLLSISQEDLIGLGVVFVLVFVSWIFLFNKLLISSVNKTLARSRGIDTQKVESIFAVIYFGGSCGVVNSMGRNFDNKRAFSFTGGGVQKCYKFSKSVSRFQRGNGVNFRLDGIIFSL